MSRNFRSKLLMVFSCVVTLAGVGQSTAADEPPKSLDPRVVVERFAMAPQIVHPIGITFDGRGRLLVIESHTHFPPDGYQGPGHDRVRLCEDTNADGKADRVTTFFEGTKKTMDIATHPDGSIYLATRNEILRLRDVDGDGRAEESKRIVFLDTEGNYPHNGLSGLAFDAAGDLLFGMGENLGSSYTLRGSDGVTIKDHGEGGNVFWCARDGKKLRRVATGFWNPFGVCVDVFGQVFAVDNDPDAMPPCRLLHVVEGGDYGYQFRYGRTGRHVFQAWNGRLPGTLPMVAGTGEAPCEIIPYESDGLPKEYLGNLLVASWADHRIERFELAQRGASYKSQWLPLIQGGDDFRPVGIATAPDGSLYVSDWVLKDYKLHGHGALWHVRAKKPVAVERPKDPRQALLSNDRKTREAAAHRLATSDETDKKFLREHLEHKRERVRAAALSALAVHQVQADFEKLALSDPKPEIRAMAVRALRSRGKDVSQFFNSKHPVVVRREAMTLAQPGWNVNELSGALFDEDPFLQTAARLASTRSLRVWKLADSKSTPEQVKIASLLLIRARKAKDAAKVIPEFLGDSDPQVRLLAAKWIADEKLGQFRSLVAAALEEPDLNPDLALAYVTTLARLDGRPTRARELADYFLARLSNPKSSAVVLARSLQLVPPDHKKLSLAVVTRLLESDSAAVRMEAARTLCGHPDPRRAETLLQLAKNSKESIAIRTQAIAGLAALAESHVDVLLALATGDNGPVRDESVRALYGTKLDKEAAQRLKQLAASNPAISQSAKRVLVGSLEKGRPALDDIDAWLARLEGPADAEAGRRVFFHAKVGNCSRCHRQGGRGQQVGPDLTTIGRADRRAIVESILQPNKRIAPRFQAWAIVTDDGLTRTGFLMHQKHDELTYIDEKGSLFTVNSKDMVAHKPLDTSIMATGLPHQLTDQEFRDLLAYLMKR